MFCQFSMKKSIHKSVPNQVRLSTNSKRSEDHCSSDVSHRGGTQDVARTFRSYSLGIERAIQSLRLQQLAALCWQFGFSTHAVCDLFNAFCVSLAHMSVWRDLQKRAGELRQKKPRSSIRVLEVEGGMVTWQDKDTR